MNLTLTLSIEEVNTILKSLGKHSFDEIAELINKIKSQGDAQVIAADKAAAADVLAKTKPKK